MEILLYTLGTLLYLAVGTIAARRLYVDDVDKHHDDPHNDREKYIVVILLWPLFAVMAALYYTGVVVKNATSWLLFRETPGQQQKRLNRVVEDAQKQLDDVVANAQKLLDDPDFLKEKPKSGHRYEYCDICKDLYPA